MTQTLMDMVKEKLTLKLAELAERHKELEEKLSSAEVAADRFLYGRCVREHGMLTAFRQKHDQLMEVRRHIQEADELLESPDLEAEMRELAEEEMSECKGREEQLLSEVLDMFWCDDGQERNSVILEIRPGTGGDEAALFAAELFRMYSRYADGHGWKVEQLDAVTTDLGGFKEVVCSINGKAVWNKLRYESGGHRVQRVPQTESQGRIHTSLATVAVLPEAEEVEVAINPEDLDISFMRSQGPGGQHVNKTSSCVRIVHKPTGITVKCQDDKSQARNRKKAMKILRAKLYEFHEQEQHEERDALRRSQLGSGDRNERIRTYNFPQDRITDHRIGLDLFGIERILMGDCDELFEALAQYDKQKRLEAFSKS